MENSKNRQQTDHLGVNKMGKGIRKSPLHQPNFANNANRPQQPQPQVYNISKNDFRNIVQQLTGSPARDPLPRPPQNPPKSQSMRLQKIRPPPLTPINRPHIACHAPTPPVAPPPPPLPSNNGVFRPGPPGQFGHPSPTMMPSFVPQETAWANTAESPISAYMRYLQNSMMEPSPKGIPVHPSLQQPQPHMQPVPTSSGLLPNSAMPALPSPRFNGPVHPQPPNPAMPTPPSPRFNGPLHPMPNHPPPQMNGPALLPSPTSQFLLPSPTGYMNLLYPGSPYPLLSPGVQFPPPLTPNFPFSPMARSGVPGPGPQPPPSPGFLFPLSPTGFFPISPRWRDQ